jgi:murein L,D-transpeptidase YcbB/YkuD
MLLSLVALPAVYAQHVTGYGVKSYKKISGDSVRLRKPVNVKNATVPGTKKSVDNKAKKTASHTERKVDSLSYAVKTYRLGERVIMPGDSGKDVRSVARILVNKIYIDESELIYTADGGVLYKGELVRAVKHFQEFNGFHVDGIIGHELIKALRKRK